MDQISLDDFQKVELRVGKIISAELYGTDELRGKYVVGVVTFPPEQIGPVKSRCLVTGFHTENGEVVLCVPDQSIPDKHAADDKVNVHARSKNANT
jgi:tRNA-binding protein